MSDLIARLGDPNRDWPEFGHDRREAKDRIEELEKERDDYAHKLMEANNTYTEMHLEIERLSDKMAKAVEALVQLERIVGDILGAHLQDSESRDKAIDLIKTTLAELEG